ncbi:DUF4040 family protein [Aeromicrobium sp. CF4.19]|uniref:DUF4040 family protein n=1 Tax=Aeromicrobium sp. CF4.19 TaxID=3373082 RepID=UPI003EE4CD26
MSLLLLVAATTGLVALAPLLAATLGPRAGWPLAAGLGAGTAGAVVLWSSGELTQSVPWIPSLGVSFSLRMDGLGLLFSVLVLGIGALVMLYSASYITQARPLAFYTLMVLFAAAMLVLVLADDLVLLFVAWELTTLCSYLLILRSGPNAVAPATRTLLVTAMGGLCLLGAVALMIARTGTTSLSEALTDDAWTTDPAFATTAAVLVAVAALTKSAQFPFHAWLPDAMVAPAPVSAYLHAAAMVKAGIYLLLRFADAASASPAWPVLLVGLGVVTSVMAAVFALQRTDIKELLAYSTVSQLGLLVAIIGVGGSHAMLAACVHVVAHALFKSAGFMYVGLIERRSGTRDIRELHGLARAMPWTSLMLALAALSMAGVPPLLGFVSKELIFDAGLDAQGWVAVAGIALAAVFTAAYSARLVVHTFAGSPMALNGPRGTVSMVSAVSVSALGGALLGFGAPLLDWIVRPAAAAAGGVPLAEVPDVYLWHGLNTALLVSAVVLGLALALVLARRRVDVVLDRPLFPGTGVAAVNRVQEVVIAGGRRVGDLTRTDQPAAHLAVPIVLVALAGVAAVVSTGGWRSGAPAAEPVDAGLLLLVTVGVVAVVSSTSRMGAVISAGIVGFSVALWFFVLGAADVALTQLLVEFLTVVIIVMVLRRLPRTFRPRAPRRRAVTGVVAVAGGVAATVATLALTGRSTLSPAGEYYVREAENETGGSNVVNTILVDFRALDTFGELVVLAVAGLAMAVLLRSRRPLEGPPVTIDHTALDDSPDNLVFLRTLARVLVPIMAGFSLYALLRGHNAPGGGFISALVGAAAVGAAYLSASSDRWTTRRLPYLAIAGSGVLLAAAIGFVGLVDGSFLQPIKLDLLGWEVSTALVFDLGVYLAVFGVILAAISLLGSPVVEDDEAPLEEATR